MTITQESEVFVRAPERAGLGQVVLARGLSLGVPGAEAAVDLAEEALLGYESARDEALAVFQADPSPKGSDIAKVRSYALLAVSSQRPGHTVSCMDARARINVKEEHRKLGNKAPALEHDRARLLTDGNALLVLREAGVAWRERQGPACEAAARARVEARIARLRGELAEAKAFVEREVVLCGRPERGSGAPLHPRVAAADARLSSAELRLRGCTLDVAKLDAAKAAEKAEAAKAAKAAAAKPMPAAEPAHEAPTAAAPIVGRAK